MLRLLLLRRAHHVWRRRLHALIDQGHGALGHTQTRTYVGRTTRPDEAFVPARPQPADWPRLAASWGGLRRGLAVREASGEPAGRGPSLLLWSEARRRSLSLSLSLSPSPSLSLSLTLSLPLPPHQAALAKLHELGRRLREIDPAARLQAAPSSRTPGAYALVSVRFEPQLSSKPSPDPGPNP